MCDFHKWASYYPNELQHRKNPSYIDAATYKLNDIYKQFCYFDINLKLCQRPKEPPIEENTYLFFRYMYYQNALFYINNCIDYLWQMLYLSFQPNLQELYDHATMEKLLETESLTNIVDNQIKYLECINKVNALYGEILKTKRDIEKFINQKKIRSKYNYIKHRGVYHIDGLGANEAQAFQNLGIKVSYTLIDEGNIVHDCPAKAKIHRENLNLNEAIEDLTNMKVQFIASVDTIISKIIPKDYVCNKGGFSDLLSNFEFPFDITVESTHI